MTERPQRMVRRVTALLVTPEGGQTQVYLDANFNALKKAADIEWATPVWASQGSDAWFALVDDEGTMKGLPPNPVGTALCIAAGRRLGSYLVGPVIFAGGNVDEVADVPNTVLRAAEVVGEDIG